MSVCGGREEYPLDPMFNHNKNPSSYQKRKPRCPTQSSLIFWARGMESKPSGNSSPSFHLANELLASFLESLTPRMVMGFVCFFAAAALRPARMAPSTASNLASFVVVSWLGDDVVDELVAVNGLTLSPVSPPVDRVTKDGRR